MYDKVESNIYYFLISILDTGARARRSWFKYCATSRKVAGSIPDYVIDRKLPTALGSTQPVTE
jgi:hypothetical protein